MLSFKKKNTYAFKHGMYVQGCQFSIYLSVIRLDCYLLLI
jgi:hypothetical protein